MENTCCIYKSKDPIRNLKIKVSLWRATGGSAYAIRERQKETNSELNKLTKNLIEASFHGREEVIISWQTKIFSKREFIKYTNPDFKPETILEEHYKEECFKLKERNYNPGRIFTYIDSDPYTFYDEIEAEASRAPDSIIPNYLKKNNIYLKKRRPLIGKERSGELKVPQLNIVNYEAPSDEKQIQTNYTPYQTMYIMADLSGQKNTFTLEDEKVLCSIRLDANGSIIVKPDFSSKPYYIQAGGFSRDTFEYLVENISSKITNDELVREFRLHKELYNRHAEYVKNLVGKSFSMPDYYDVLKVHVLGEILWAKNFDYDDLHVYYELDLPKNWQIHPKMPKTSGYTQTSRTKTIGTEEIAYFSHPFEFVLFYKNDDINPNNWDEIPKMPKILFEVASYDTWKRYRTEGYAWTQLQPKPGVQEDVLPCWRPRGDSLIYEMRRFFIGGSPELEDISYVAVPSNLEGSIMSRMGFRTVTTGSVKVRLQTIYQSQIFMDKKKGKRGPKNLLAKIGGHSNLNDFISVLDAFNKARTRMVDARENAKPLLEQ